MVVKTENGYEINGVFLSTKDANEVFSAVQRESRREDIISKLERRFGTADIPEDIMENIIDDYAESEELDESWSVYANKAIDRFYNDIPDDVKMARQSA